MGSQPRVADPAPAFEGIDQHGARIDSRDLLGRWVVLYFYPKDETAGCTREACSFRDQFAELRSEGAVVIGVSGDSSESHAAFAKHHRLPFSLLADADGAIQRAYGARGLFGLARRLTFLIDPAGRIARSYRVRPWDRHAADVLRDLITEKMTLREQEPTKAERL